MSIKTWTLSRLYFAYLKFLIDWAPKIIDKIEKVVESIEKIIVSKNEELFSIKARSNEDNANIKAKIESIAPAIALPKPWLAVDEASSEETGDAGDTATGWASVTGVIWAPQVGQNDKLS